MKHFTLALPLLLLATTATAQEKLADCRVTSNGAVEFEGPCGFLLDAGGTFSIASPGGEGPLYGEISVITVFVVAPGEAEVSGLTTAGINSRWGSAQRSASDPACWTGSDFEVCAY
jgi:hypothetical protein